MPKVDPFPASVIGNSDLRDPDLWRPAWIWEGLLMEEGITLLTAPEKTGKTTLLSLLLDRRRDGGCCSAVKCEKAEASSAPRSPNPSGKCVSRRSISGRT